MTSTYKIQAEAIDQEARQEVAADPEIASRIDKTLPYLCLEMLLQSPYLSVNQMVIAAGTPFGIISKFEELVADYRERDLIEIAENVDEESDETFYKIADKQKAESMFMEIASKMS